MSLRKREMRKFRMVGLDVERTKLQDEAMDGRATVRSRRVSAVA